MLDKVKAKLAGSKEPLVPISLRIETTSKTAISLLAGSYGVKSNELIRYILQSFVEEAWNEPLNYDNLNPDHDGSSHEELLACENFEELTTLGDMLKMFHPELYGRKIISKGFEMSIVDQNLGDTK